MDNASARNMWGNYLDAHLEYTFEEAPRVIHFCNNERDANECANLVKSGIKKATSHSLLGIQCRGDFLPKIGSFLVITDWDKKAVCIVKTTGVKLVPYFNITQEYARLEGEGDQSLEYWKKTHWDYYTKELVLYGRFPKESMIIVCQEFEKVYG